MVFRKLDLLNRALLEKWAWTFALEGEDTAQKNNALWRNK